MLFIIVTNAEAFVCVKARACFNLFFGSFADHKTCFLPLYGYEIEIRNSLLGYKNQFSIVCGSSLLGLLKYLSIA